ncbi:PEP-CTERM sorting domain-containing protein [Rubritalea tangerina]|uniref:PEP-CTERM sorting domain-containing protein n=1 Tax=Rubritalea tangerina TaxID=430798 RepID=A0ABW4ZE98_9BACT
MKYYTIPTLLLLCTHSHAATVSAVSDNLWTDPATWSDNAAPSGGNDYTIDSGRTVTSPTGSGAINFAGDSLTVNNGGTLRLANDHSTTLQTSNYNITNLSLNDGATLNASQNGGVGATDYRLTNTVAAAGNVSLQLGGGFFFCYLTFENGLSGDGTINFNRFSGGGTQDFRLNLSGSSSYSGDWNLSGSRTTVFVNAADGFGSGSVTANANMLIDNLNASGLNSLSAITLAGNAELQLTNAITNNSASISMESTSQLDLVDTTSSVLSLTINGNSVSSGTYDAAQLTALGFGGTFDGSGSITIIPEPSSSSLILLGSLFALHRRKR